MDELDECNEIIFICQGSVVVGYEINKVKKYCIKFKNNCVINAFGATFSQKSEYVYAALTDIHGFCIRLENWIEILVENPHISSILIGNVMYRYFKEIRIKCMLFKIYKFKKMASRKGL